MRTKNAIKNTNRPANIVYEGRTNLRVLPSKTCPVCGAFMRVIQSEINTYMCNYCGVTMKDGFIRIIMPDGSYSRPLTFVGQPTPEKLPTDKIIDMWTRGEHIAEMAEKLQTTQTALAVVIMHLAEEGKLNERSGGVFGGESL